MYDYLKHSRRTTFLWGICLFFFTILWHCAQADAKIDELLKDAQGSYNSEVLPKLEHYCMDCHDPDEDDEAPFLEHLQTKDILNDRHLWRSVAAQLRNRTMPPKKKKKQPSEQERLQLSNWIEGFLRESALELPAYAGSVVTRRLNRNEYNNTIRDLIGLDLKFSHTFPVDASGGEGFDNHAATLYLPPILMESYIEAAGQILDQAIQSPKVELYYTMDQMKTETTDQDSVYQKLLSSPTATEFEFYVKAKETAQKFELQMELDELEVAKFSLDATQTSFYIKLTLDKGLHKLSLAPVHKNSPIQFQSLALVSNAHPDKNKHITHQALFKHIVNESTQRDESADQNLSDFMQRAFRRPVLREEVDRYKQLYKRAIDRGDSYEDSLKLAFKAILVSPHFLFMIETPAETTALQPLPDFELASRLAYFLWSSMPDDTLLALASQGELKKNEVLKAQVDRMLKDKKSLSFFEQFVSQWLGTVEVGGAFAPDGQAQEKTDYRPELGNDLKYEPVHFFKHMVLNHRHLTDFINADYVVVNERIAKHYDLKDVKGNDFQWISLKDHPRGGVLGFGAVHMATSNSHRTSPVKRGAWVIETLLGTPVPPPPNNVPLLDEKKIKHTKKNLRQILEEHRNNESCSACHNVIDPIGFGLENFDFIGKWRELDQGVAIDPSGVMPSGELFSGPSDLKKILLNQKDQFVRHLTSKLLGYALGRQLIDRDAGTVEHIVKNLKDHDYDAHLLIESIVLSIPFRNKSKSLD